MSSSEPAKHRPLEVAERLAESLVSAGAEAVAVVGSQARGDAAAESDLHGESIEESCRAALRLFELAVDEARALFDERQIAVLENTLRKVRT